MRIEIGDSLWWQGRTAYWTPQCRTRGTDIPIRRIGYSGVKHPRDWTQEQWDDFHEENKQARMGGVW